MAGPATTGTVGSSPFDCLFTRKANGTYEARDGKGLGALLRLVVHPDTYGCVEGKGDERINATDRVLIDLVHAIMRGDPPRCPPIPWGNASPCLKGLTEDQKRHLEWVLLKGNPKDPEGQPPRLRQPSTYLYPLPEGAGELPPWSPPNTLSKTPADPEERRMRVNQWCTLCFVKVKESDGIQYAIVNKENRVLEETRAFIEPFIVKVVQNEASSSEYKALCEAVERARLRYSNQELTMIVWNFIQVLARILVEGDVSLNPPPEPPPVTSRRRG